MIKLAKIREYVVTGAIIGALGLGTLYAVAGGIYTAVANNQNGIHRTIEIDGKKVTYEGVRPHNPLIKFFWQHPKGYAEIKFDGSVIAKDSDLTKPGLSLEDKVTIILPGSQEIEFSYYGIYNNSKYHPFEEGFDVKGFLQGIFSQVQENYKKIEENILQSQ